MDRGLRRLHLHRHAAERGIARLASPAAARRQVRVVEVPDAEQLAQRPALRGERIEDAVHETAEAPLDLFTCAALGAVGVAVTAGSLVEHRTNAIRYLFDGIEGAGRLCQQPGRDREAGQEITEGGLLRLRDVIVQ